VLLFDGDNRSAAEIAEAALKVGLTICRSIAEAHGGELRYEPSPGSGTIFRFTLPWFRANEPANGR
jgi:K+-sensing histidine kinase KdpD